MGWTPFRGSSGSVLLSSSKADSPTCWFPCLLAAFLPIMQGLLGFCLLSSLNSAYTFIKILFIKLVSNHPVGVCHLFSAKILTNTVGNNLSSNIFSITPVTLFQNRMIILSAKGKFSLIGRKQSFPSQLGSFVIQSES